MSFRSLSISFVLTMTVGVGSPAAAGREPPGLHTALSQLTRQGHFSGAVVVRGPKGILFARGYGAANPFTGVPFTPDTFVDSGSIAKPVTAAAVLLLAQEGKIDLDSPVASYLPEYPHSKTTVRHLLSHSAGLALEESPEGLAGKDNAALLAEAGKSIPMFQPGTAFAYCNLCYSTLAMLIERVSGIPYLEFAHRQTKLPAEVSLRPRRLPDWKGRAIGYRRNQAGEFELFDSWEGETFYGSANLSVSAAQLAQWGSEWWHPTLAAIRTQATRPALIAGNQSGLSWGSWYCAPQSQRCHYLGHHEGFHHMLYWDASRRISIAMVSNNALAPAFQQSLQRALVAFVEKRPSAARREIQERLPAGEAQVGEFRLCSGEILAVKKAGKEVAVQRKGISYPAYPTGSKIRYVPGLDGYLASDERSRVHWSSLYDRLEPRCLGAAPGDTGL